MMEAVRTSETSVDNHFTRQYNPEDSSEHIVNDLHEDGLVRNIGDHPKDKSRIPHDHNSRQLQTTSASFVILLGLNLPHTRVGLYVIQI
jgi:hypothetical protein